MTFDPEKHLLNLPRQVKDGDGYRTVNDQYLEVKWRLVWFRDKYPNGTIETEEVSVDLDREVEVEATRWVDNPARPGKKMKETYTKKAKGYARYRAIVTNGEGGKATATKTEAAVDFPDYCEKAETGAVGRALAMLGIGTQFVGQELNEHHRIVDAPVKDDGEAEPATNQPASSQPTNSTTGTTTPPAARPTTPAPAPKNQPKEQPTKTTSTNETGDAQENKNGPMSVFGLRLLAEGLQVRNSAGAIMSWSDILAWVFRKYIASGAVTLELLEKSGESLKPEYRQRLVEFLRNYEAKMEKELATA